MIKDQDVVFVDLNNPPERQNALEELSQEESIDYAFDALAIQTELERKAQYKAQKILKKNKREISRLKTHAANCVLTNNYFGYKYAIQKLRGFYKQPYNDDLIKTMWETTRQTLFDMVKDAKTK